MALRCSYGTDKNLPKPRGAFPHRKARSNRGFQVNLPPELRQTVKTLCTTAWFLIPQLKSHVIAAAVAVRKVGNAKRFPRRRSRRLFHSFPPPHFAFLHTGSCFRRRPRAQQRLLILHRRTISERGVQTLGVVDLLEEVLDRGPGFAGIAVFLPIHLFVFQRLHERFAGGIVVGVPRPTHADRDPMLS